MATGSSWIQVFDELEGRLVGTVRPEWATLLRPIFRANGLRLEDEPMLERRIEQLSRAERPFRNRRRLRKFALRAWAAIKRAVAWLRQDELTDRIGALR